MSALVEAEVVTVYLALDGGIHHARCSHRLTLHGQRGGLELDFYCLACAETVFRGASRSRSRSLRGAAGAHRRPDGVGQPGL